MRKRISTLLALALLTAAATAADPLGELFPAAWMRDVKSLDLKILDTGPYRSHLEPNRTLKRVDLEFTSFEWAGERWRHHAAVLLPDRIPPAYKGAGAVVSLARGPKPGEPMNPYAEIAALLGVPTLVITSNNPGPHYGVKREGDLMGFGQRKALETGDPRWLGYDWLGKVIVRAVTALAAVPGVEAERFVVTGCSKRGAASWIAAATDERIAGAFPACWNSGNVPEWLSLKARRWGLDYQPRPDAGTMAPAFITTRQQMEIMKNPLAERMRWYSDPYEFRSRLRGKKILYAAGTNDPLFPVASDTVFLPHMNGVRILLVPNAGHTPSTRRHLTAWRMWLAHVFAGRDVPVISAGARRRDGQLRVRARVRCRNTIRAARVWSARDDQGAYLGVTWTPAELTRRGDAYEGAIPAPAGKFVGCLVEVEDTDAAGIDGIATTGFLESRP